MQGVTLARSRHRIGGVPGCQMRVAALSRYPGRRI